MLNHALIGGYHWRTCLLFRLFLLAGVIIGNLKRDHESVIIDTAIFLIAKVLHFHIESHG